MFIELFFIICQLWLIVTLFQILTEMGSAPELVLCPLSLSHQGHYICRVNHGENCVFSQWAQVRVIHSAGTTPSFPPPPSHSV